MHDGGCGLEASRDQCKPLTIIEFSKLVSHKITTLIVTTLYDEVGVSIRVTDFFKSKEAQTRPTFLSLMKT